MGTLWSVNADQGRYGFFGRDGDHRDAGECAISRSHVSCGGKAPQARYLRQM